MIYEVLRPGRMNAMCARDIAQALDISCRDVSEYVRRERLAGLPICSSTGRPAGFWIAETREDMEKLCNKLQKQASRIYQTRRACKKIMEGLPDSMES